MASIQPQASARRILGDLPKSQWEIMAAIHFKTVKVWTKSGLVTYYLLFVMEPKPAECI